MKPDIQPPDDRQASEALTAFWEELEEPDASNADDAQSKHSTLTIDPEHASEAHAEALPEFRPSYIQGIVSANQIYLVTNLLKHESQALWQPQLVWTIGRNRAAALPLQDRKLSRRHAVILYGQDGFYLLDLNSMNGSYINGTRVQQRQRLQDGDFVCVGSTRFFFFVSSHDRKLDAIHPEVLTRLNQAEPRSTPFVDFSELNEEISINVRA